MKLEDIKPGEKYKLELFCILNAGNVIMFETPTGDHLPFRKSDLECVSPAAPKYSPYRLFRNGDIVEPCLVNGRCLSPEWKHRSGIRYEVTEDENPITADLYIKDPDSPQPFFAHAAFFKLVTPVEEREPYSIADHIHGWIVYKDTPDNVVANFNKTHPNAKAAAEAERDRLNAEYRKEMEK